MSLLSWDLILLCVLAYHNKISSPIQTKTAKILYILRQLGENVLRVVLPLPDQLDEHEQVAPGVGGPPAGRLQDAPHILALLLLVIAGKYMHTRKSKVPKQPRRQE